MKKLFSNMKQRYSLRDYKFSLVVLVLAISVIGIFMVRSARPEYMTRQILGVILGVTVMVVISLIDYNWVLNFYWLLYGINLILLIAVLLIGHLPMEQPAGWILDLCSFSLRILRKF